MPEKAKQQPKAVAEKAKEPEESKTTSKEESHEDSPENGGDKQEETETSQPQEIAVPKRRGRKSKENDESPSIKKAKVKEAKTPERTSSRVRNRSIGEKLPAFKDMDASKEEREEEEDEKTAEITA